MKESTKVHTYACIHHNLTENGNTGIKQVFRSKPKSPVISSSPSKNVKELDHYYHHFALLNAQMSLKAKEESCPKSKSQEKELSTLNVYKGLLEA